MRGPFRAGGHDRRSLAPRRTEEEARALFALQAGPILERHRRQSLEAVMALKARYSRPVLGQVRVWELIERLGSCIDPTDERLFGVSQQVHVRQILAAMEEDGTATPEMVLVALVHDLGKVLLLTGEDPANVVCMNTPIGQAPAGSGLANCVVQWNHDEFAYDRLKGLIPDDLAWLVRYHSLELPVSCRVMDAGDLERTERLLVPFAHYDHATKSPYVLPSTPLEQYRDVVEEAFPHPIWF